MNISGAINQGSEILLHAKIPEARREVSDLLSFVLERDRVFLIAHPEYELTQQEAATFDEWIGRRSNREPFHYIVGRKEFYGLEFEVSPGVLIPRPETEILVEQSIAILSRLANPMFCEIGVGSGCISISILKNISDAKAMAVDISHKALSVAESNSKKHGVSQRLRLFKSDLFSSIDERFDLIVSNPPYIPERDRKQLQEEVRNFEPPSALFGGVDGLSFVRKIVDEAPNFLNQDGKILIEIGYGQANSVKEILTSRGWKDVSFANDLQLIPRVVYARFQSESRT